MKLKTRLLILASSLGLVAFLPSCQSTATTAAGPSEAVMCAKCKTVWISKPVTLGSPGRGQVTVLRDSKTMTCPECQLAADNYWKTGSMKHTCSHCGDSLTHCTQH